MAKQKGPRLYNHLDFPGLVYSRTASNGKEVGVYRSEQAGIDTVNGIYPWSCRCEEHGEVCFYETKSMALLDVQFPEDWCGKCGLERQGKQ